MKCYLVYLSNELLYDLRALLVGMKCVFNKFKYRHHCSFHVIKKFIFVIK